MRPTSKHLELYPSKFFNFVFMGSIRQNKIEAVIAAAVVLVIEILVTILVLLAGTVYSVAEEVAAAALTNCFATFAILSPSTLPLLYQFLCHKQSLLY